MKIDDQNENNNNNSKENKTSMVPKIIMLVVGIAVAGGIGSIRFLANYSGCSTEERMTVNCMDSYSRDKHIFVQDIFESNLANLCQIFACIGSTGDAYNIQSNKSCNILFPNSCSRS